MTWQRSGKAEVTISKVTGGTKLTNTVRVLKQARPRGLLGMHGLATHATTTMAAWQSRARRRSIAPATVAW